MPELSIVIVNYNTASLTVNCIRSVYKQTPGLDLEVVLIDNGSTEKTDIDFQREFPQMKFRRLKQNQGFSRGNNAGIELTVAPVVLLLNSDTIVRDNALERTYEFLLSRPDIGMVGCKLLNEDLTEQESTFIPIRYPLFNLFVNTNVIFSKILHVMPGFDAYSRHAMMVKKYQQSSHYCEAISGAFMMFKKEVISPCGYLDPDFFLYSEETEWCRNRIRHCSRIFYYNDAAIIHLGGRSSPSTTSVRQMLLSSFLYSYKVGYLYFATTFLIYFISVFLNFPVAWIMKKSNRRATLQNILTFLSIIPDILFEIPRFSRRYGSRPYPLMIREIRRKYFDRIGRPE